MCCAALQCYRIGSDNSGDKARRPCSSRSCTGELHSNAASIARCIARNHQRALAILFSRVGRALGRGGLPNGNSSCNSRSCFLPILPITSFIGKKYRTGGWTNAVQAENKSNEPVSPKDRAMTLRGGRATQCPPKPIRSPPVEFHRL